MAAALAHGPEVVFLEEPTTGLDVASARELRGTIAQLRDQGVTAFLTKHHLEEAERFCDRIALLVRDQIVALDTVEGLKSRVQGETAIEVTLGNEAGEAEIRRAVGEDAPALVRAALARPEAEGQRVLALRTVRPILEDAFVQLTGISADMMRADRPAR